MGVRYRQVSTQIDSIYDPELCSVPLMELKFIDPSKSPTYPLQLYLSLVSTVV